MILYHKKKISIEKAMEDNLEYIDKLNKDKLLIEMKDLEWNGLFNKVEEKYMRYHIVN